MRQAWASTLIGLAAVASCAAGPHEAVAAAAQKLRGFSDRDARFQRFLTDYDVPEDWRGNFEALQRAQVHGRSRTADPINPESFAPTVYRIDLRDYGWPRSTWERLLDAPEPFFHAKADRAVFKTVRGRRVKQVVQEQGLSKHFDTPEMHYLIERTGSQVPIVLATWFFVQTCIQEDRALGYYDLLGVEDRDDYERLIGLTRELAVRKKKEVRAIVKDTGIARHPRQIERLGVVDGAGWRTLDVLVTGTGKRNALEKLDADYEHQVEEHIGHLPNDFLAMFLCDAQGKRQDKAPQEVGGDKHTTSNDFGIHVGLCWRCHKEGLRPIDDWARKTYAGPLAFGSTDRQDYLRKRQLYLGELQHKLLLDRQKYEFALAKQTGWTPRQYSSALKDWWEYCHDAPVTLERMAALLGCTPGAFRAAVIRHGVPPPAGVGKIDAIFGDFVHDPPRAIRREHAEEYFQRALNILHGAAAATKRN